MNLSQRQQLIIQLLRKEGGLSSSEVSQSLNIGQRSILRDIEDLIEKKYIERIGKGKAIRYKLSEFGSLHYQPKSIDLSDERLMNAHLIYFDFDRLEALECNQLFSLAEQNFLDQLTELYLRKRKAITFTTQRKEMERLIIEFSWKSSQIEGNTYTLLETEALLQNLQVQKIHSTEETQMILNHKTALDFILLNKTYFLTINSKKIIELHSLIVRDLGVETGLRKSPVGITGSLYKPPDTIYQITEALEKMCSVINQKDPYSKGLLASLLTACIQPFADGNKRLARILSNAILYAHDLPLLSFRSVSVEEYKEAVLAFYELGSIYLYKKLYLNQLEYFVKTYF